jgi:hypothetical protein
MLKNGTLYKEKILRPPRVLGRHDAEGEDKPRNSRLKARTPGLNTRFEFGRLDRLWRWPAAPLERLRVNYHFGENELACVHSPRGKINQSVGD